MGKKNPKTALILALSAIVSCYSVPSVCAAPVSLNDLIEAASQFDGQPVTIEAELIGEALNRGEYSWLNVNDGTNAIGVWVTTAQADTLVFFGDYDTIGDTISLTGVFHQSCPEHGGDVDIHAAEFSVMKSGFQVKRPLSISKLIWAVSLSGASAIGGFLYLRSRPRKPKKEVISAASEE